MPLSKRQLLVMGLVALGLTLALYESALFGDGAFFYRDVFRQYWPVQEAVSRAWSEGHWPLWNDATQGGIPLLANLHAGVFSPSFALFRVLEFHRAYAWLVAGHHALLLLGWFFALRSRFSLVAAAVGALGIGLSGYALGLSNYLAMLVGMACMGWQVAALQLDTSSHRVAALATLFAVQVLAGDVFPSMLSVVVLVVWLSAQPSPELRLRLGEVAAAGALALVVCAVQLGPAWALFEESARATWKRDAALAWSFDPRRFVEWAVETPFGNYGAGGITDATMSQGPDARPFLMSHFLGLVVLAGAVSGLALERGRRSFSFGVLLLLGAVLSLGSFFEPMAWLLQWPPFSFFKYPEKYQWLCVVAAGCLAAEGIDALRRRRDGWWWWAAPAFVTLELGLAGGRLVWLIPHDVLHEAPSTAALVTSQPGRLWRATLDFALGDPAGLDLSEAVDERRFELHSWASALPTLRGVPELGGYSPAVLARWQRVLRGLYGAPDVLYRMWGVRWVVTSPERVRPSAVGLEPRAALAPSRVLYEYKGPAPRVFSVGQAVVVGDTDAALEAMRAPGFDPLQTAVVESTAPVSASQPAQTSLVSSRAGRLEARVEAPGDALIVFSETYSRGWRAIVDGVSASALVVDGTLLGVSVGPGVHTVVVEYEQPGLATGAAMSVVGSAVLAWLATRRRRRPPAAA